MTPLWARMLVFEAWKNEEITEECAHYFDKLILDKSKSKSVDGIEFEYSSMEDVLDSIGRNGQCGEFDLMRYINTIHYEGGRVDPLQYPKDVYLSEITKVEKRSIWWIFTEAINKITTLEDLEKIDSYLDRIDKYNLIQNIFMVENLRKKIADLRAEKRLQEIDTNVNNSDITIK